LISDADWLDAGDVTNASIMTANADTTPASSAFARIATQLPAAAAIALGTS
jgi:hypothetical protein